MQSFNSNSNNSEFTRLRDLGTSIYCKAVESDEKGNWPFSLLSAEYEKAFGLYTSALTHARDPSSRASAHKNAGQAKWRIVHAFLKSKQTDFAALAAHLKMAIFHTQAALLNQDKKQIEWLSSLNIMFEENCNRYANHVRSLPTVAGDSTSKLHRIANFTGCFDLNVPSKAAAIHFGRYALNLFQAAITLQAGMQATAHSFDEEDSAPQEAEQHKAKWEVDEKSLHSAVRLLNEAEQQLQFAVSIATRLGIIKSAVDDALQDFLIPLSNGEEYQSADDLMQSIRQELASCKSILTRMSADRRLKSALFNAEFFEPDEIWLIIDEYRQAAFSLSGFDLENEAIALYQIACCFSEVLKLPQFAHRYYYQVVRLGLSLQGGKDVSQAIWFRVAQKQVAEYQEIQRQKEEAEKAQQRGPILEKLKETLDKIQAAARVSSQELLRYVYSSHPPKRSEHTCGSLETNEMKKTLRNAILHYHPDKNREFGEEWAVLAQEITKVLNSKYEYFK